MQKRKGERIAFCFHLILCAKERHGDALISRHNNSPSFCCIVNYSNEALAGSWTHSEFKVSRSTGYPQLPFSELHQYFKLLHRPGRY